MEGCASERSNLGAAAAAGAACADNVPGARTAIAARFVRSAHGADVFVLASRRRAGGEHGVERVPEGGRNSCGARHGESARHRDGCERADGANGHHQEHEQRQRVQVLHPSPLI